VPDPVGGGAQPIITQVHAKVVLKLPKFQLNSIGDTCDSLFVSIKKDLMHIHQSFYANSYEVYVS